MPEWMRLAAAHTPHTTLPQCLPGASVVCCAPCLLSCNTPSVCLYAWTSTWYSKLHAPSCHPYHHKLPGSGHDALFAKPAVPYP